MSFRWVDSLICLFADQYKYLTTPLHLHLLVLPPLLPACRAPSSYTPNGHVSSAGKGGSGSDKRKLEQQEQQQQQQRRGYYCRGPSSSLEPARAVQERMHAVRRTRLALEQRPKTAVAYAVASGNRVGDECLKCDEMEEDDDIVNLA